MTASEKLTQLIEDDKLTEEQRDNLHYWGIRTVSELRDNLIDLIGASKDEDLDINYARTVRALYDLLDYDNDDDYVTCDEHGVHKLDFDKLNDALDFALKSKNI